MEEGKKESVIDGIKDNGIDVLALTLGIFGGAFTHTLAKNTGKLPSWAEPIVTVVPGIGLAMFVTGKGSQKNFARSFGKGFAAVGAIDTFDKVTSKIEFLKPANKYVKVIKDTPVNGLGATEMIDAGQEPAFLSGMRGLGNPSQQLFLS